MREGITVGSLQNILCFDVVFDDAARDAVQATIVSLENQTNGARVVLGGMDEQLSLIRSAVWLRQA
jgi:hypothetical protein